MTGKASGWIVKFVNRPLDSVEMIHCSIYSYNINYMTMQLNYMTEKKNFIHKFTQESYEFIIKYMSTFKIFPSLSKIFLNITRFVPRMYNTIKWIPFTPPIKLETLIWSWYMSLTCRIWTRDFTVLAQSTIRARMP